MDLASNCEIDNSKKRIVFCLSLNNPSTFPTSDEEIEESFPIV